MLVPSAPEIAAPPAQRAQPGPRPGHGLAVDHDRLGFNYRLTDLQARSASPSSSGSTSCSPRARAWPRSTRERLAALGARPPARATPRASCFPARTAGPSGAAGSSTSSSCRGRRPRRGDRGARRARRRGQGLHALHPPDAALPRALRLREGQFPVAEDASARSLALPFFTGDGRGAGGAVEPLRGARAGPAGVGLCRQDRQKPWIGPTAGVPGQDSRARGSPQSTGAIAALTGADPAECERAIAAQAAGPIEIVASVSLAARAAPASCRSRWVHAIIDFLVESGSGALAQRGVDHAARSRLPRDSSDLRSLRQDSSRTSSAGDPLVPPGFGPIGSELPGLAAGDARLDRLFVRTVTVLRVQREAHWTPSAPPGLTMFHRRSWTPSGAQRFWRRFGCWPGGRASRDRLPEPSHSDGRDAAESS